MKSCKEQNKNKAENSDASVYRMILCFFKRRFIVESSDLGAYIPMNSKKRKIRCKKAFVILSILFYIFPVFVFAGKTAKQELPSPYKKWLEEEAVYIITPKEKSVFLQLKSDRERDLFIDAFWRHRDPTPGTPENEFKKEHYRRLQYANYTFGRASAIPGWKTDRGWIYILLGEPRDIERITGDTQIYNAEIWFYQGLSQFGLPAGFNLIFYQKRGVGEYVLYSPTNDGPQALMTSYFGDQANYMEAYNKLKKINPTLAQTSMSLIPGESSHFGRPSLSSDILIQNIYTIPQKQFEDKYAEKFLLYKDIVEVEYSANYIPCDYLIRVFKEPSGFHFVHYVIELKKFSVTEYQGKYTTNLILNGTLSNSEGKTIYQFESSLPFEFDKDQLKNITYNPFNLHDMFPLVPGDYKISVLLKNEVSREFTSFEDDIHIPHEEERPWMSPLLLGYKTEIRPSDSLKPFKLGQDLTYCQPQNVFQQKDRMHVRLQLYGLGHETIQNANLIYEIFRGDRIVHSIRKNIFAYDNLLSIGEEFELESFMPGYYKIKTSLVEEGKPILSREELFEITPAAAYPRPWLFSKTFYPLSHPIYTFILGRQHFQLGNIEKARVMLEKSLASQPDSVEAALALSQIYILEKDFSKAKSLLLPFSGKEKPHYDVLLLLGNSHQFLGEYDSALASYQAALDHFGVNFHLLNAIGECYSRLKNDKEALYAWEKSLEINPNQPEIKEKVESIRKKQE